MDWNGNNIEQSLLYWTKAFLLATPPDKINEASANIAAQLKASVPQHEAFKSALDGFGKVMFAKA